MQTRLAILASASTLALLVATWPAAAQVAKGAAPEAASTAAPDTVVTPAPTSASTPASAATSPDLAPEAVLLSEAELDTLVAPVALYPDALLAQIFVAATYPLDVIKADRFVQANDKLGDKERVQAAEKQPWDPSIQVLAGAFPQVINRMATEIDWTENLGNAVVAQTDDVLLAVQRMRARAAAAGNLTSNEAQTVETVGDTISIAPADPQVVYVPTYDSTAAFAPTTTYTEPAVVGTTTTTTGMTTGGMLMTGVVAFGGALLLSEIFEDDDDWNGYWGGPPPVDWDNGNFYPNRGGVNVNGDVNIDRSRDRVRIDTDNGRIGDGGRPIGDRNGAWSPTPQRKAEARQSLAARESAGNGLSAANQDKLKARSGAPDSGARAKIEAASAKRSPDKKISKSSAGDSILKPGSGGPTATRKAADRGAASLGKGGGQSGLNRPAKPIDKPKSVSKPNKPIAAAKRAPAKATVFDKPSSGSRAKAASNRGHRSTGGRGSGGGGRGGGGGVRRH